MFVGSIVLLVYLAFLIGIPILVGVYVFQDARRRGMNAALWTLIAVLVPMLAGFIIYLLVRGNYPDLKCPQCGSPVRETYVSCPQCGARLKASCPNCSAPVEPDWKVCPRCASPLSQNDPNIQTPIRKKDRGLGVVLGVVVVVPLAVLLILILSFTALTATPSGGTGVAFIPTDEYLAMTDNPEIQAWLEGCGDDPNTAYVLRHKIFEETGDSSLEYLIYMPGLPQDSNVEITPMSNLLGKHTLRLTFEADGINPGSTVALLTCSGNTNQELDIYFEPNQQLNCEITSVDYPLSPLDYPE